MIAVGVDTHKEEHVVAALDALGQLLGETVVAASEAGYRELAAWLDRLGVGVLVGIEGAGSYGAGLCEHLLAVGVRVVEVERPRRRERRLGIPLASTHGWPPRRCLPARASRPRGRAAHGRRFRRCWSPTAPA